MFDVGNMMQEFKVLENQEDKKTYFMSMNFGGPTSLEMLVEQVRIRHSEKEQTQISRPLFDHPDYPKTDDATRILSYRCAHGKELDDGTLEMTTVNIIDTKNDTPRSVKNMQAGSMISKFMTSFGEKLEKVNAKLAAA